MNALSIVLITLLFLVLSMAIFAGLKNIKRFPWIAIGIIIGILSSKAFESTTFFLKGRHPEPILIQQMFHLREALISYKFDHGKFPEGTNSDIAKSLEGNNSKRKNYFSSKLMTVNEKGEFVDTWGRPFRIILQYKNCPIIFSSGKNREFEGAGVPSDDLVIAGSREDVRVSIFQDRGDEGH